MKFILSLFVLSFSFSAMAIDQDLIKHKALQAAQEFYAINISSQKGAAEFTISKETCGGEDGTQVCEVDVLVKEKNPINGVTSYKATFMNDQLQKLEQNCNYCY